MLKIRFRDMDEKSFAPLMELVELATNQPVKLSKNIMDNVDLEITGPYGGSSDSYKTPFTKRIKRLGYITFTNGKHFTRRDLATGIQPNKKANKNVWYSGENTRPPQGEWDGYMAFDTNLSKKRHAYLPLWFLTSTNLLKCTTETYWGSRVPTLNELLGGRKLKIRKKKFAASFIGKSYPMRLHAIEALSEINRIDIYGTSVRNQIKVPAKIAARYRYILCFENDIYPGYVTEKPLEAYIAGAIPLYFGFDVKKYLNSKAIVNLFDFQDIKSWVAFINELEKSYNMFKQTYEQPILVKKPDLNDALNLIKSILEENN